jgi:hypothetical protein
VIPDPMSMDSRRHTEATPMALASEALEATRARILDAGEGPVTRHARLDAAAGDS